LRPATCEPSRPAAGRRQAAGHMSSTSHVSGFVLYELDQLYWLFVVLFSLLPFYCLFIAFIACYCMIVTKNPKPPLATC
jgi:hypothetical protein